MNVSIKGFAVQMEVNNKGVEFEIRNTKDEHLGDIVINKSGLIWCEGRTSPKHGKRKTWEEIIEYFNED